MDKKTFVVPNIGCDGCVRTIVNELSQLEGVNKVQGDVQSKVVTVEYEAPATWDKIQESLAAIDYAPEPA
jgi:copper chaperone CopZ